MKPALASRAEEIFRARKILTLPMKVYAPRWRCCFRRFSEQYNSSATGNLSQFFIGAFHDFFS
jgi:hypothetical protein